jgi:putative transposase
LTSHDRISSTHTVANSFAERSIGTLLRELLDRTIIWNQHRLVTDYIDHYNTHRPHRSLDQRPPLNTTCQ